MENKCTTEHISIKNVSTTTSTTTNEGVSVCLLETFLLLPLVSHDEYRLIEQQSESDRQRFLLKSML